MGGKVNHNHPHLYPPPSRGRKLKASMQPLRQIRRRIKSVENTKKMTRAMEMVAAAKLKKLHEMLKQSDRYIGELRRI